MDMGGHNHGGMSMGGIGNFQSTNIGVAHAFWYLVAATCAVRGTRLLIDLLRNTLAKRRHTTRAAVPSKPTNIFTQTYETTLAIFREMSYPAMQPFTGRMARHLTPPPLGQCLFILTFWAVILTMLWSDVLLAPTSSIYAYRWEKPAFRAGWVSITQVPLIYALSCKINIVSIITGISYERLNWLHRWVSRTLFLTVIVHWAYFFHEWTLADFVSYQFQIMPMVKYGFGAWAVIGWSVLSGFGYFRHLRYELWVIQHLASAGLLLWLLWVHVPVYAQYNIWMAVAFVAFDRGSRGIWSLVRNLHLKGFTKLGRLGFQAEVTPLEDGYLRLAVKDVDFTWNPGQHVFLSIPTCGIFESHPFTISNSPHPRGPTSSNDNPANTLEIIMKCHSGFTQRLRRKAEKQLSSQTQSQSATTQRTFLSGPWGKPPLTPIQRSNALSFISSSTGASYTLPLLEHAIQHAPFLQHISFTWIIRHPSQLVWFEPRLRAAAQKLIEIGVQDVSFRVFVTGTQGDMNIEDKRIGLVQNGERIASSMSMSMSGGSIESETSHVPQDEKDILITGHAAQLENEKKYPIEHIDEKLGAASSSSSSSSIGPSISPTSSPSPVHIAIYYGRPSSLDPLIRPVVEAASGETVVVACAGLQLMAQVRSYVAALSDERAVHKGTGAQGIQFWGEGYGW